MISKILLTLGVIVVAIVVLKQRKEQERTSARAQSKAKQLAGHSTAAVTAKQPLSEYRIAAYVFLAMMFALAGAVYFFNWQDDHRIVTVTLHGDEAASPVIYQVYQYQLQNRSFTTIDGIVVNVAGNERMVVEGLEP